MIQMSNNMSPANTGMPVTTSMGGAQMITAGLPGTGIVPQQVPQSPMPQNMNAMMVNNSQQLIQTPTGFQLVPTSVNPSSTQGVAQATSGMQGLQGVPNVAGNNVFQTSMPQCSLGQMMQAAGIQTVNSVSPQGTMSQQVVQQSNPVPPGLQNALQQLPTGMGLQQVLQSGGIQPGSVIQLGGNTNGQPIMVRKVLS